MIYKLYENMILNKIAKLLKEETLIINVDQLCINRHTKTDKSWGFKRMKIEVKSLIFEIKDVCEWRFYQMEMVLYDNKRDNYFK